MGAHGSLALSKLRHQCVRRGLRRLPLGATRRARPTRATRLPMYPFPKRSAARANFHRDLRHGVDRSTEATRSSATARRGETWLWVQLRIATTSATKKPGRVQESNPKPEAYASDLPPGHAHMFPSRSSSFSYMCARLMSYMHRSDCVLLQIIENSIF